MKRTALKRTRFKPSKRTAKRRKAMKDLDADARESVFVRDNRQCQRCGQTDGIQWHHVVRRSKSALLRHDVSNGLTLCNGCHKYWWHLDEHAAMNWFISRWPERNAKLARLRELTVWVGSTESHA